MDSWQLTFLGKPDETPYPCDDTQDGKLVEFYSVCVYSAKWEIMPLTLII